MDFANSHLDRHELPIQSILEKCEKGEDDLTVVVPVNTNLLKGMKPVLRHSVELVSDAKEVVKQWYNEDIEYHMSCFSGESKTYRERSIELLSGYETFKDEWELSAQPDSLGWKHDNSSDKIGFIPVPVVLFNQWDESCEYYSPEKIVEEGWIENFSRPSYLPDTVYMKPEKMRQFGGLNNLTQFKPEKGVIEVIGYAYCSDYQPNMGKALLLRDYAVYYLNHLSDKINLR